MPGPLDPHFNPPEHVFISMIANSLMGEGELVKEDFVYHPKSQTLVADCLCLGVTLLANKDICVFSWGPMNDGAEVFSNVWDAIRCARARSYDFKGNLNGND